MIVNHLEHGSSYVYSAYISKPSPYISYTNHECSVSGNSIH